MFFFLIYIYNVYIYVFVLFFFPIPRIVQLRRDMIDQKEGETNFAIKIHYDNMVSENNIFTIVCFFLHSFIFQRVDRINYLT